MKMDIEKIIENNDLESLLDKIHKNSTNYNEIMIKTIEMGNYYLVKEIVKKYRCNDDIFLHLAKQGNQTFIGEIMDEQDNARYESTITCLAKEYCKSEDENIFDSILFMMEKANLNHGNILSELCNNDIPLEIIRLIVDDVTSCVETSIDSINFDYLSDECFDFLLENGADKYVPKIITKLLEQADSDSTDRLEMLLENYGNGIESIVFGDYSFELLIDCDSDASDLLNMVRMIKDYDIKIVLTDTRMINIKNIMDLISL